MSSIFTFIGHTLDLDSGIASFSYQIDHEGETYEFIEELQFGVDQIDRRALNFDLLQKCMDNLLLILGISYYKLFCPKEIRTSVKLTEQQAHFWNTVYTKGLGEFFYKNNIDFHNLIHFPYSKNATSQSVILSFNEGSRPTSDKTLLFFAGGKDSIVSAELLKKSKKDFSTLTINPTDIQTNTLKIVNKPSLFITRTIDQQLLELNKEKIGYNGHVPFNAIAAFIGLVASALYDFSYLITSNEASSNYGNVTYLGENINHQWSKSLEFEELFKEYVNENITKDIVYFSLLRPLYDIKIVELFSTYPEYFPYFSSCNRNFMITEKHTGNIWCGECPKCLFAFILLSAFLDHKTVMSIFGKNLLADEKLLPIFKQLLGQAEFKPFECVGTPEETILALCKIYHKGEYIEGSLMDYFEEELLPQCNNNATVEKDLLETKQKNLIPDAFEKIVTI